MLNKKKVFIILGVLILSVFVYTVTPKVDSYYKWINFKSAIAASGCPWMEGGTITAVHLCVADNQSGTCPASCPLVSSKLASLCTGYNELDVSSQLGTIFVAVPKTFVYSGGGSFPKSNNQFIACGASNIVPWVIGIPGS